MGAFKEVIRFKQSRRVLQSAMTLGNGEERRDMYTEMTQ